MSEKTIANDILKYGTQSVLKSNDPQSQIRKEDEEADSPVLADDTFDDSSSSYCTALCSLSDYSEALEDEECMICAEPQCVDASSLPTFFADPSGETSSTTWPETAVPLKELKTEEAEDTRAKIPKHFPSSPSIIHLNSINTNSADVEQYNANRLKELEPEGDEDMGTSEDILREKNTYIRDFPSSPNVINLTSVNINFAVLEQYNEVPLKEFRPREDKGENVRREESLYIWDEISLSDRDSFSLQSKPFPSSLNLVNLNSVTTHSANSEQCSTLTDANSSSARDPLSLQSKPFPASPNSTNLTSRNTNSAVLEQYNEVQLKEFRPWEEKAEDMGTPLEVQGEESLYIWDEISLSARDPLLLQSKSFLSSPNSINLTSGNTNSADVEQNNTVPLKELKPEEEEEEDIGTAQDLPRGESLYIRDEVSSCARNPLLLQSKPFPSTPNFVNLNSVNTKSADSEQYNAFPLKDLKPEENEDIGTLQDITSEESLYVWDEVSLSARDPLLLQSKPFPSNCNIINWNSANTIDADVEQYNAVPLKDLEPEENEDIVALQGTLSEESLFIQDEVSTSYRDPLLLQSKPFRSNLNVINVNSAEVEQYKAIHLKELKAGEKKDDDAGTSQHILDEKSLYVREIVSSSVLDPLLLQSKPFPRSSNKINLNSMNTNSADSDQSSADLLRLKRKESLLKPWDYFRSSITKVNTQQTRFTPGLTEEYPCEHDRTSSPGEYSNILKTKYSSSNPKRNLQRLNIINSVDAGTKTAQSVDSFCTNPLLNSCDYFNNSKTTIQRNTTLVEQPECLEPTFISNTILTTSEVNQYNQEVGQQQSDTKPKEDPLTHQQSLRDGPNKLGPEDKLDRGGSMAGHRNWEGEEQGRRVEKEQAELSLKARNRKPPACCISTLTANKQKSGIPPRCYSERILATGHQHPPRSPPVSWRWQKQSRQGVLLSSSLPPKPCSTARQHCSAADNTKDAFNMATKLVKTNTEVRSLDTLDHARSSCPEASYLDVFSSSRWSSNQLSPDEGFHDLSTDVLSIKLPMISTKSHNTSACSEASSVECIDVALESREEVNRGAKTVPKRQIQLKRRDPADSQTNENISNDGLLIPATSSRPRDILQRQHSTPAAFHQDSHGSELKVAQTERKQRLQKSLSLDETSSKTKKASCLIKTILSKKMQEEENLRTDEVPNRAFAPIKAYNPASNSERLTASTKEVCVETTTKMNLTTGSLLSYGSSSQSTVKEHISVSSKIQPKMMKKHSFNPLFSARPDFPDIGTEITTFPEKSEKEKLSSSKEGAWIASQSSGEKLSCDSAKGKVWNLSAGMGKQATVKTTPEECFAVQRGHKQHNVKTDLITSMVKQVKQGESKESTQCLTMAGCLAYDQDVRTLGNILSPSGQYSPEKEPEHDREDPRPPGHSVNMGIQSQGKFKAIAPVHVVRDMRSLVKNTYSLSFRGPGEAAQGTENSMSGFSAASPHQISSKGEDRRKGFKQDEKAQVRKVTPPLALDRIRDLASLHKTPKGCATKPTALLESHDKSPTAAFTKVSPIIAAKANSCALSKSPEAQCIQKSISQADVQGNITNLKQTNLAGMQALQSDNKTSTEISKNGQSENSSKLEYKKQQDSVEQRQHLARQYCPPTLTSSSEELESCKPSDQIFSTFKDDRQTPGPPPRPQSTAGPAPACILTVAPTPVLPQYFYKANPLGYQTVSPHMGTVSYVQGPVMLQTPPLNQPAAANCPIPLMRSLSEEVRLLSQPFPADGSSVQQRSSMQQTENGEIRLKVATPDTQQCTAFVATLGAEVMQGSTSMLYQEMGGGLAQSPRQLLLDPETGRCFYVDMPQLPQRKMLFDPQTCQYVEVLLPQQTIPSPVMPSPCAIPVPSFHIPAIYTPHCLPYVQAHPQLLPPPGP